MKLTPEEISLCKQVAEKHRKEIGYGDWHVLPTDPHLVPMLLESGVAHKLWEFEINKKAIPLWTISDCLEFLRERGLRLLGLQQTDDDEYSCGFCETDDIGMRLNEETAEWADGETPLEACLKAVLAVLGEE